METFKKNWITYLGITFLFLGFLYFLKIAIDEAWIPPVGRVALGLVLGVTGTFIGYNMYKKQLSVTAEIIAGLGVGIIFATFGYAGFSNEITWSTNALVIAMIATTAAVTYISTLHSMRILMFISILGGLLTPLVIKAQESQVWVLFLFVLLLNIAALYISALKNWKELRIMSFVTTVIIYISYYFLFDPEGWQEPIFYLSTLFVTYLAGLIVASLTDNRNFEGINLYLNVLNGINFVFWSMLILDRFEVAYAFPAIFVGFLFIITAIIIHYLNGNPKSQLAPAIYGLSGIVVIAIATHDLGLHYATAGMQYVISSAIWLALISFVFFVGHRSKKPIFSKVSLLAWVILFAYWYSNAWNVAWPMWFGVKYIPFINPGALVWIALATTGFIASRMLETASKQPEYTKENIPWNMFAIYIALMAHVVVGGLLTIQIQNTWKVYNLSSMMRMDLVLSITWLVYALIIFLWGAYTRDKAYRILGTIVIGITSLKIFFLDLNGSTSIQKVMMLMIAGGLTLTIAYVNNRWAKREATQIPETPGKNQNGDQESVLSPEEKEWI